MLKQKLSKAMRDAADGQPGRSHTVGYGKRGEAGDRRHGSARIDASGDQPIAGGKVTYYY